MVFWISYVSFSSKVRRIRVFSSLTRGSVSKGKSQYSRNDAAKSMVVSWASLS